MSTVVGDWEREHAERAPREVVALYRMWLTTVLTFALTWDYTRSPLMKAITDTQENRLSRSFLT